MASPTIPVRLADGAGNVPAAANWNDDYDFLTTYMLGLAFIANGGMELWTAGTSFSNPANGTTLADSWVEVKSGTSACTADVTRESTTVDSGTYSMKVNITGAGSSDSYWAIKQSVGTPTAFSALTVVAGVKVKVATANKVRIKVYDGSTTAYSSYHTGDGTWQLLQAKLVCQNTPTEVTVTIEINPANFTDAIYIDSAYLYVVPASISSRAQAALVFTPLGSAGSFLPLTGGTLTGALKLPDGTVSLPALSFANDPDCGIYRIGTNDIAIATNGTIALEVSSSQAVAIKGTSTNDNAGSGYVGQYISATVNGVAMPSSATWGDITSISLPAGDWDVTVSGMCYANSSSVAFFEMGATAVSGNSGPPVPEGDKYAIWLVAFSGSAENPLAVPNIRFSLASTTTVYWKAYVSYSGGSGPLAYGRISARRVR